MSAAAERLAEALTGGAPAREEGFVVDTREKAIWALRKLKHILDEKAAVEAAAREEIKRVEDWLANEVKRLDADAAYFEGLLADYHRRVLAEDPRAKTIRLPHGTLKVRAQQPEYRRDEAALLAWVKANRPELVKVKEDVDWAALKKSLMVAGEDAGAPFMPVVDGETGAVVEGVLAVPRPDKFSVEII